jgi:hypothetical protein
MATRNTFRRFNSATKGIPPSTDILTGFGADCPALAAALRPVGNVLAPKIRYRDAWAIGKIRVSGSDENTLTTDGGRRAELEREREEAQAELDEIRADHTGSQQFALPRIKELIHRVQEIDRELEQIELATEIERQLDS